MIFLTSQPNIIKESKTSYWSPTYLLTVLTLSFGHLFSINKIREKKKKPKTGRWFHFLFRSSAKITFISCKIGSVRSVNVAVVSCLSYGHIYHKSPPWLFHFDGVHWIMRWGMLIWVPTDGIMLEEIFVVTGQSCCPLNPISTSPDWTASLSFSPLFYFVKEFFIFHFCFEFCPVYIKLNTVYTFTYGLYWYV